MDLDWCRGDEGVGVEYCVEDGDLVLIVRGLRLATMPILSLTSEAPGKGAGLRGGETERTWIQDVAIEELGFLGCC